MSRAYLFFLLIVMSVSQLTFAETTIIQVPFIKVYDMPEKKPDNPDGNRMPQRPIVVTMSDEGIEIPLWEKTEILSYSVYNEEEELLYASCDDIEFVSFLFTLTGSFEICISTAEYSLHGWVYL